MLALLAVVPPVAVACASGSGAGPNAPGGSPLSASALASARVEDEPSADDPNRYKWNRVPPGATERYGHAELVVHAPPDAVRAQVLAFGKYRELAPTKFEKSRVIGADAKAHTTDVYLEVPILKGAAHFWAVMRFDPPQRDGEATTVEAHMVEGNMKTMHAKWRWEPKADGTLVSIDLLLMPNFPVPQPLIDQELRDAAGNAVRGVERRVGEPPATSASSEPSSAVEPEP